MTYVPGKFFPYISQDGHPIFNIFFLGGGWGLGVLFHTFFLHMSYVPGNFCPYFLGTPSGHLPRWQPKKVVCTISYGPLVARSLDIVGLEVEGANLIWAIFCFC